MLNNSVQPAGIAFQLSILLHSLRELTFTVFAYVIILCGFDQSGILSCLWCAWPGWAESGICL